MYAYAVKWLLTASYAKPASSKAGFANWSSAMFRSASWSRNRDRDLIALGKHAEVVFEVLLVGSTTKHILAESQNDVLVAR